MGKVSLLLALVLVILPIGSVVLGQSDDPWASVLDQATKAGISQDAIDQASKAIGDGSAQKAAEDMLGNDGQSLGDWIQQADDGSNPSPAASPEDQSDFPDDNDDIDDSPTGAPKASSPSMAPKNSPSSAPGFAPKNSPNSAPKRAPTRAPQVTPSPSPSPNAWKIFK